jgi:sulfate transport system permease protein
MSHEASPEAALTAAPIANEIRRSSAQPAAAKRRRAHRVLPGFGLSLGFTLCYLSLLVLFPLAVLTWKGTAMGWDKFWALAFEERTLGALKLSFGASAVAALLNAVFGSLVAWVLVRYRFPGRALFDALVDLPFALPTAVGGIALVTAYGPNGILGKYLSAWGIKAVFTPVGVVIALTFIGLPFVVRTVQPVLAELEASYEEAAATLGAGRLATLRRVLLPQLVPALLTGTALAFARAVGEYGSVVFISGNIPFKTEIAPLLIMTKLEQYDYDGAAALAVIMLGLSFVLLLLINVLQWWSVRRVGLAR